jgi:hypothetical protein
MIKMSTPELDEKSQGNLLNLNSWNTVQKKQGMI